MTKAEMKYTEFYNEDGYLPEPLWGPKAGKYRCSPRWLPRSLRDLISKFFGIPLQCPHCNSQDIYASASPDDPCEVFLSETVRCGHCGWITDWYEALCQRRYHPTNEIMEVARD